MIPHVLIGSRLRSISNSRPTSQKRSSVRTSHSRSKKSVNGRSKNDKEIPVALRNRCSIPSDLEINWVMKKITYEINAGRKLNLQILCKLEKLIKNSPINIKLLLQYFNNERWSFSKFIGDFHVAEWRNKLLGIFNILIEQLINNKELWENNVLRNITNNPKKPQMDKSSCLILVYSTSLLKMITEAITLETNREIPLYILNNLCVLAKLFNERRIYDVLAGKMLQAGTFMQIINILEKKEKLTLTEERYIIKIIELSATLTQGISLLNNHLPLILQLLHRNLLSDSEVNKNSIITLLLDLTANEDCLEEVAEFLMKEKLIVLIILELQKELENNSNSKHKDILMGIILNLSCNVESENIQMLLLNLDIPKILTKILFDSRKDWPSNGSSLALLQYAHKSLENIAVYQIMNEASIRNDLKRFVKSNGLLKAKKNIREALDFLEIADEKQKSIKEIIGKLSIAPAA